jgi:hypothetical protein
MRSAAGTAAGSAKACTKAGSRHPTRSLLCMRRWTLLVVLTCRVGEWQVDRQCRVSLNIGTVLFKHDISKQAADAHIQFDPNQFQRHKNKGLISCLPLLCQVPSSPVLFPSPSPGESWCSQSLLLGIHNPLRRSYRLSS